MAARGGPGLSGLQKAAVLLGLPAGAAVLYIVYRRYREGREDRATFVGAEELEAEVRVPRAAVRALIGRQGATIRKLRQETGARIALEEEEEEEEEEGGGAERLLLIAGSPGQVCRAQAAVRRVLADSVPVLEQLRVPHTAVGRIIGRGGETVRSICLSSGAKVQCERRSEAGTAPTRLIRLSGTRREVAAAKKLIVEKLLEDDAFRKELARAAAARGHRKQPLGSRREAALPAPPEHGDGDGAGGWPGGVAALLGEGPPEEPGGQSETPEELAVGAEVAVPKFEVPSPEFGFPAAEPLEVYVSAAENPEHFWVQLVGERSLQLDQLTAQMSRYYEGSGRTAELAAVQAGDIVAAPYGADGAWYRARVLGALPGGGWDLYYVDFGDNGEAQPSALRALRSDFLSLPFQAIECSLAGVAPVGTEWAEAALDAFEQLTHCARWKPLRARVCSYGRRGPRTWPRISLSHEDLDVAAELVRLGHAAPRPREEEEEEEWEEEEAAGDEALRWGTETTPEDGTGASLENLPEPRGSPRKEPPTPAPPTPASPTPSCLSPPGKQRPGRAGPGPRGGEEKGPGCAPAVLWGGGVPGPGWGVPGWGGPHL
ncbi:tudor and KH domain-containing protein [Aythya fuligula]|uniref:Tudor and KH domain-containing protein n=1 Tax=Aythya fuligula TaxID=219594 RepID=A0A6J3EAL6_AYTFU|nr:tudor and KH domain-containing protein [Aythya fuligula]